MTTKRRRSPRVTPANTTGESVALMCSWCGAYLEIDRDQLRDLGPCPVPHKPAKWWRCYGGLWRDQLDPEYPAPLPLGLA